MGETPKGKAPEVGDLISALGQNVRKVDASALRGEVRILKKSELKKIIQGLMDKYGSADKQQLMDRRDQLKELIENGQKRNEELQRLLSGGQEGLAKVTERNQRMQALLDQARAEEEKTLDQMRARLRPYEQQVQQAHGLVESAHGEANALKEKIVGKEEEVHAFELELEKDPIRKKIRDIEERLDSLKESYEHAAAALDFFAFEEVWNEQSFAAAYSDVGQKIGTVDQKLSGDEAKTAKAVELRNRIQALQQDVQAGKKKINRLVEQMNEGEAGTAMVMEIIRRNHDLTASVGQLEVLTGTLLTLPG